MQIADLRQRLRALGAGPKHAERVLLKHVQRKGITVDRIMRDIRSEVVTLAKSAGHEQVPAIYDQVVGDYYFAQ